MHFYLLCGIWTLTANVSKPILLWVLSELLTNRGQSSFCCCGQKNSVAVLIHSSVLWRKLASPTAALSDVQPCSGLLLTEHTLSRVAMRPNPTQYLVSKTRKDISFWITSICIPHVQIPVQCFIIWAIFCKTQHKCLCMWRYWIQLEEANSVLDYFTWLKRLRLPDIGEISPTTKLLPSFQETTFRPAVISSFPAYV